MLDSEKRFWLKWLEIVEAIKEVLHLCNTRKCEQEGLRSTLLSAICAPGISTRTISKNMDIFENRNHAKLKKFRERRQAFISGSTNSLAGMKYAKEQYGFPECTVRLMRK